MDRNLAEGDEHAHVVLRALKMLEAKTKGAEGEIRVTGLEGYRTPEMVDPARGGGAAHRPDIVGRGYVIDVSPPPSSAGDPGDLLRASSAYAESNGLISVLAVARANKAEAERMRAQLGVPFAIWTVRAFPPVASRRAGGGKRPKKLDTPAPPPV